MLRVQRRFSWLLLTLAGLFAVPAFGVGTHESEVVGLSLQGTRKLHRLTLGDLDAIVASDGDRRIPLLRILDALQVEYTYDLGRITIMGIGAEPVVIDIDEGTSRVGEIRRPLEIVPALSEISGDEDFFLHPQALGELLSIHLEWDEMEYAFLGRTNREWPLWKKGDDRWQHPSQIVRADLELPEMFPSALPNRNSFGFLELQTRFRNASGDGPLQDFGFASSRSSLWGSLLGGNYKLQLVSTQESSAVLDNASWNYRLRNTEVSAGDSILGLSDLVFPSMRVFGVRFNGIRGLHGETDGSSLGLRQRFTQTRVFEGIAPVGSKVSLVIDDRIIHEQEIFPDVASAPGFGQYRFDDVLLRTGLLNDIRVIVLEPNGTIRETQEGVVQSPLIAPRGTFGFLGGVGTDRQRLDNETQGLFGGFRAVYGITDNLTISGAAGVQGGLYEDFLGDFSAEFRGFPDLSYNVGAQVAWRPWGQLLMSADVAMSRAESGPESDSYDDTALRITNEYYPTRRTVLRSHVFRYGPDYFNGQNLNLRDREGFAFDGRFGILPNSVLEFSLADLSGHLAGDGTFRSEAAFQNLTFSTSTLPRTTLTTKLHRLEANWSDEARTSLNVQTQTLLPGGLGVRARFFTGDSFTDSHTSRFFSGLNLPGVSVFHETDRSVSVTKQLRGRGAFGVSYLENPAYYRPTVFGSTTFQLLDRPLSMGLVLGYDEFDDQLSTRDTEPYFENQTDLYLSSYGKSRIGLRTRLQRGNWSTSFNMSFLTSLDSGLRARLLKSPVRPDQGGVHGMVFLDYNANGLREKGEPGVSNIEVHIGNRSRVASDHRGHFIMPGSDKPRDAKVFLDLESVPAHYSASHGQQTAHLQPGQMTRVNLGLTPLIAVTGYVFARDGSGEPKPLAGARVVLRKDGITGQIQDSYTGRDGSFYVGDVRPGDYRLHVDPETVPEDYTVITGERPLSILPGKTSQEIGVPSFLVQNLDVDPDRPILADASTAPEEPAELEPNLVAAIEEEFEQDPPTVVAEVVLPGGLDVNWQPWANIKIEGYPELVSPCSFEGLIPGTYQVVLSHPELGELTREVEIPPGEQARLVGTFQQVGVLSVNAAPWADVLVDGKPRGSTPLQLSVPEGQHIVALVNRTTAETVSFAVDMPRGGVKRVRHQF